MSSSQAIPPDWGIVEKFRVPTVVSKFQGHPAPVAGTDVGEPVGMSFLHVPMGVQTACDPGIYAFGKTLGVDPSSDEDPVWDFGHTGLQLWPISIVLGDFLLSDVGKAFVNDRIVVELGCGMGLMGPIAMLAGARKVVLTDVDPLALSLCEYNVALNRDALAARAPKSWNPESVLVRKLDWRDESALSVVLPKEGVDVVLAADVVYEDCVSANFRSVVHRLTALHPKCKVLLGVKYRKDHDAEDNTTTTDLQADLSCDRRSVVARWLQDMCRVDPPPHDSEHVIGSASLESECRQDRSRSPHRMDHSPVKEDAKFKLKPEFEAELLLVKHGLPPGDVPKTGVVRKGLHEVASETGRSNIAWDESKETGGSACRFEIWCLSRSRI